MPTHTTYNVIFFKKDVLTDREGNSQAITTVEVDTVGHQTSDIFREKNFSDAQCVCTKTRTIKHAGRLFSERNERTNCTETTLPTPHANTNHYSF